MTTQPAPTPHTTPDAVADALPRSWQRLLALSGVVFAALFVVGWFTTGGVTPHYTAPDQDWTKWARDNQWNGRISGFLMLLAGFVFLYFVGVIRSVFGSAESRVRRNRAGGHAACVLAARSGDRLRARVGADRLGLHRFRRCRRPPPRVRNCVALCGISPGFRHATASA
jgi:hypothetical protein